MASYLTLLPLCEVSARDAHSPCCCTLFLLKSQALWAGEYKNIYNQSGNMEWSNLSIKLLGINLGNFILDNCIWDKISENIPKKIHIWNRIRLSLRGNKMIINQILLSKLWYIGQIYTIPKYIKKEIEKRIYDFLREEKKIRPPRHLVQLPIAKSGLGILDINTQLNSLKINWIKDYFILPVPYGRISCCID